MSESTFWDELGPFAGEMAGWAVEREEPWTVEALALELYVRDLVRKPEDLKGYRAGVIRDVDAWQEFEERGADESFGNLIVIGRFRAALEALTMVEFSDVVEQAVFSEIREAQRQAEAGRKDEGIAALKRALEWQPMLAAERRRRLEGR